MRHRLLSPPTRNASSGRAALHACFRLVATSAGLAGVALGCQSVPAQQPDAQPPTSDVATPSVPSGSATPAPPARADAGGLPVQDAAPEPTGEVVQCPPRVADAGPVMCTKEYRPVCAMVDTGVRCITTPCPSAEFKTFGNGCTACASPKTLSYRPGACGAGNPTR